MTYWRPIFKISNNNSIYAPNKDSTDDDITDSYQYWRNGESNFNTYSQDIKFILSNSFNTSGDINYRSLMIDDCYYFYTLIFYKNQSFTFYK